MDSKIPKRCELERRCINLFSKIKSFNDNVLSTTPQTRIYTSDITKESINIHNAILSKKNGGLQLRYRLIKPSPPFY